MKTEQQLDDLIAALPQELAPERDLWPQLEQRLQAQLEPAQLEPSQKRSWQNWWPVASAASLLLAVLWWGQGEAPSQLANQPSAAVPEATAAAPVFADAATAISFQYQQAKAQQLAALTRVSPVFADWQQQLGYWDSAISQVQMALHYNPNDAGLLKQLRSLYNQQQQYLQKVVQSGLV